MTLWLLVEFDFLSEMRELTWVEKKGRRMTQLQFYRKRNPGCNVGIFEIR